jgi:hypothetical protein
MTGHDSAPSLFPSIRIIDSFTLDYVTGGAVSKRFDFPN